jgi:hypothetical protein
MSFRLGSFVPKKNYLIDTFLLPVYLIRFYIQNPEKIFTFWQIFEVEYFHQSSNLMFVVSFWLHNVSVPQQAVSEMGVGLPQPVYRSRLQTALSGFG